MGKAMFKVDCPELNFSRSVEIPIDARGYARQLAEDLTRAMDVYGLRIALYDKEVELINLKRKYQSSLAEGEKK